MQIDTSMGSFTVELYYKHAPKSCKNFEELAKKGYYDGTKFHRIIRVRMHPFLLLCCADVVLCHMVVPFRFCVALRAWGCLRQQGDCDAASLGGRASFAPSPTHSTALDRIGVIMQLWLRLRAR